MTILKIIQSICIKLRMKFFPTPHEKEITRYFADGGDERFRLSFALTDQSLVIDLGGYKGQWASDIYAKYNCTLLVFEPVSVYYHQLVERFKLNSRIKIFHLALAESKRTEQIGLSDEGSSLFINTSATEIIQLEDVAVFFKEYPVEQVDLLKINTEGAEYALLNRLIDTGLINNIQQLHIQFHDFIPNAERQLQELTEKLSVTHVRTMQYKFVWENWVRKENQ